jgi:hypothetical protein
MLRGLKECDEFKAAVCPVKNGVERRKKRFY